MIKSHIATQKSPRLSHFARSTLLIAFFFGVDKVLAFVRQIIVNNQFGLSYELDVFNVANNIPDLLSALISGGALGVALIPVLSDYLEKRGRGKTWALFVRVLNLAFIVTALLSVVIALFAPWLIEVVIAPGFPAEQQTLAVELMRLDLVAILIFSLSGLAMAALQANQHFLLPALAPALYNVGQIFGALILAPESGYPLGSMTLPHAGMGIHGLVWGVILGALLHLGIQVPGLLRYGFRWQPVVGLRTPGVQQVLRLMGPRVLTMLFIHIYFVARDNLASPLPEGSITALNLGWFIMQVPETLLGSAVAIALLPSISELFSLGLGEKFTQTVNGAVRAILAFTIPSAVLLAIGLPPLVARAFPAFSPAEVDLVVWVTRLYLAGLTGHALLEIASRSFYATQNAKTPMWAAALNALVFIVLAVWLTGRMGAGGIALAGTLAFTSEAILLLWLLGRGYQGLLSSWDTLARVALASILGSLALYGLMRFAPGPPWLIALLGMLVGLGLALPLVWPEIKAFAHMGRQSAGPADPRP
ncbi:MAG: murein biosynthesis integral membrane protein MurJ [Anaerolineales bacterium]|nr:murein biosynthesis integral membrane protein MurJ [Anaerolineales bacterium]